MGLDPSLRGFSASLLIEGRLSDFQAWTDKITLQTRNPSALCYYEPPKGRKLVNRAFRINMLTDWLIAKAEAFKPNVVAFEDYAFGARSVGATDIHELVGTFKRWLWVKAIPYRIYPIKSVKKAWTGKGNATKGEMIAACLEYLSYNFEPYGSAGEDLADSSLIALLLETELGVRNGRISYNDLSDNLKRILKHKTKAEPIPLLERDLISSDNVDSSLVPIIRAEF
jgi:Holliday junction resolvasome RuvABC endonuclease subunit